MSSYCQLQLTCKDRVEADTIINTLLVKRLIACAKQIPISSDFRWQGKIEHADEVLLIMDSKTENFNKIETEVKKLHSYKTFVLQMAPVQMISGGASKWMEGEI